MCLIFLVTAAIIGAIVVKVTGVGDKVKSLPGDGNSSPETNVRSNFFSCS